MWYWIGRRLVGRSGVSGRLYLRLILLRKKRNKLLQRSFQMFLRYKAFRILHEPSDLWDGADLGMSWWV